MKQTLVLTAAMAVFFCTSAVYAQTNTTQTTNQPCTNQFVVRVINGHRTYESLCAEVVPGEIQRPYAFAVTSRAALGYQYETLPVHFVDRISSTTRRTPF